MDEIALPKPRRRIGEPRTPGGDGIPAPPLPWFLGSGWRLFGTLFLALGLLLGTLAFLLATQARRSLEAQAVQHNALVAQLIRPAVERHFSGLQEYVESFARRPGLREAVRRRDIRAARAHLEDLVAENAEFDRAFIADPDGVLWADYPPAPEVIGRNFSFRNWFRGVSRTRQTYISRVYRRSAPPRPFLVAIAVPVRDARGQIAGYLVGQHTIDTLIRWLDQIRPSEHGSVALIDHRGTPAVPRDPGAAPLPSLAQDPLVREALAGGEGTARRADPVTGRDSLISYTPITPIGWAALVSQPVAAVLAPVAALQRTIVALSLAAFALVALLGFLWLNTLRRSHQALRESAARFRAVAETANDAVVSADEHGDIIYLNPAAERIFGHPAAQVRGRPLTLLMPPRFHAAHCEGFARALAGGEARILGRTVELVGLRRDGSEFPLELSLARWSSADRTYFTGILRDIGSRKQAEESLQSYAAQLEAANRELESFSYSVSHDLRAPLRAIDGFSQALIEDCAGRLGSDGQAHLERVRAAAQRMGHLIDDLLKLSRITRSELAREEVDLSALAGEVAQSLRRQDPAREVRFDIAPGITARADPRLMRAALDNLMGNAWKFTARRPQARIAVGTGERDGGQVYFVEDNGAGFDMAYAGNLFGAFQRLHDATEFPGTGIGLATVQRIIHKHGGRIWAEAAVDRGATFLFTLDER